MRLIDLDAAIEAVRDRMDVEKHGRTAKPEEIQWALERVPTVHPQTGHWIQGHSGNRVTLECDQCNYTSVYKEKPIWTPNYCPNCGARMT